MLRDNNAWLAEKLIDITKALSNLNERLSKLEDDQCTTYTNGIPCRHLVPQEIEKMRVNLQNIIESIGEIGAENQPRVVAGEWIPCTKQRLPEGEEAVLVATKNGTVFIAERTFGTARLSDEHIASESDILAWMPLPLYKEEKTDAAND